MTEDARKIWEDSLRVGDRVVAAWGYGSGFRAHGLAEIVRINRKTYRVRLLEDVPTRDTAGWPKGYEIGGLERFSHVTWYLGGWHPDKAVHPVEQPNT